MSKANSVLPEPIVTRFSPVSRTLRGLESRANLASHAAPLEEALEDALNRSKASVLSLDVFDTLLLRDNQCEARRFWELSKRVSAVLAERFRTADFLTPENLLTARVDAMQLSYRVRPPVKGCREGALHDVAKIMRRALNLPKEAEREILDAEIAYEAGVLVWNDAIGSLARRVKERGGKVILVSDMYLSGEHIADIIKRLKPNSDDFIDHIYSSCDLVVSKRSGRIFREIERDLELSPDCFFHIGDSLLADFHKPRESSWSALHFPVSDIEAQRRAQDLEQFILEMRAIGYSVEGWAKV